jgi:hypothetical protein
MVSGNRCVNGWLGGKVVRSWQLEDCLWIYRVGANPGMPRGGILPPAPVLAPGSALGSRPRVALSSAQAPPVYSGSRPPGNSRLGRALARRSGRMPLELRAKTKIKYKDPHPEEEDRRGAGLDASNVYVITSEHLE